MICPVTGKLLGSLGRFSSLILASSRANSDFGSVAVYVYHGGVSGEVYVCSTRVYYAGGLYGSWFFSICYGGTIVISIN